MNYFIIVNDTQQGPYTIEELRQRHIDASTLVWAEGMAQWTPAWQVEELKTLSTPRLAMAPTPPQPHRQCLAHKMARATPNRAWALHKTRQPTAKPPTPTRRP